ncbi:MAG: PilN domain-containing protein [Polaromonas sp.]|nr:PilN domain-containing protein [Polaromonas sp.]
MILVNLLPHREAARKRRREAFYATLALSAVFGILIGGGIYSWYSTQIDLQGEKNTFLKLEIGRLDAQIKDIATLQAEIASLRARQNAVEDLQGNRNLPVYLLDELSRQMPDGVYISSMKQENQVVVVTGIAQSNERVSEVLRNFSNNSAWLTRPELQEITAGNINLSQRDQRRVANFSMRFGLKRPAPPKVEATTAVPAAPKSAAAAAGAGKT